MRIADLHPGVTYRYKTRTGGTAWGVCVLLDVRPWIDNRWGSGARGYRPHDPTIDQPIGPQGREVPVADLRPVVTLGDGSEFVMDFGWQLHVGTAERFYDRSRVSPARLVAVAEPMLLNVRRIDSVFVAR